MIKSFFFSYLICFPILLRAGGPWSEGQWKGFAEVSSLFSIATTTTDNTYQLYSELGLSDEFTVKFIFPLKQIKSPSDMEENTGIPQGSLFGPGNIVFGMKYKVYEDLFLLSLGADLEFPGAKRKDDVGLRSGFDKYSLRPIVSIGKGFDKSYAHAEFKPAFNTNNYSHEMGVVAEVGGQLEEILWLAGYIEYRGTIGNRGFNETDEEAYSFTGFFRDQQRFLTLGLKISVDITQGFGISGGAFYGIGFQNGTNAPNGGSVVSAKAGLYYNW